MKLSFNTSATEALEALDQQTIRPLTNTSIDYPDLSNSFSNLPGNSLSNSSSSAILKPLHTDVICNRHQEYIEIILPSPSVGFVIFGLTSFILPLMAIIYSSEISFLNRIEKIFFGDKIFFQIMILSGTLFVLAIIFSYSNLIKLRIDRS